MPAAESTAFDHSADSPIVYRYRTISYRANHENAFSVPCQSRLGVVSNCQPFKSGPARLNEGVNSR
jgi:hypothetical protein